MKIRFGGFGPGFVAGLLVGLALAAGVALSVAKATPPFVDKVPQRNHAHSAAEIERNLNWDPNGALANRTPWRTSQAPKSMENE